MSAAKKAKKDLTYPPKGIDLGYASFFDPKTDTQYMATITAGPDDDQINLITTSLTGGTEVEYFTLDVKFGDLMTCMLEEAQDPTTNFYKIQRNGRVSISYTAEGRDYLATLILNPNNTDLTNIHILRCDEPKRFSIRGGIVRVHHSGWWAVAVFAIFVAAIVTLVALEKCVPLGIDVEVEGKCKARIGVHKG